MKLQTWAQIAGILAIGGFVQHFAEKGIAHHWESHGEVHIEGSKLVVSADDGHWMTVDLDEHTINKLRADLCARGTK